MNRAAFADAAAVLNTALVLCGHATLIQVFVAHSDVDGGRPHEFEYCQDCGAMRMLVPHARWFAPTLVQRLAELVKLEQETPGARQ